MLNVRHVHVWYGQSQIIQGVDLTVSSNEIVCLLGRNGVGKTTLMKTIMGILPVKEGEMAFERNSLKDLKPYEISRLGISYVPQGREIFARLTVEENLKMGMMAHRPRQKIPDEIFDYFPILKERLTQRAGTFSGGQQQMLAIARALVSAPKLLLLDEPTEGIQPSIVDDLVHTIMKINKELNISILLIEQNLDFAFTAGDRFYVMEKGKIVSSGDKETVSRKEFENYLAI